MTRCVYCGELVDPDGPNVWHRIQAWERKASGGSRRSGSDIALRERLTAPGTAAVACGPCVGLRKSGITVGQGSLL